MSEETKVDDERHEDKVVVILTRPALERLLGGDSELEVRLRHAAAAAFAKHHLTLWANSDVMKGMRRDIADAVVKEAAASLGKYTGGGFTPRRFELSNEIKHSIAEAAATSVRDYLSGVLDDIRRHAREMAQAAGNQIELQVRHEVDRLVEEKVAEEVKRRLELAARLSSQTPVRERIVSLDHHEVSACAPVAENAEAARAAGTPASG